MQQELEFLVTLSSSDRRGSWQLCGLHVDLVPCRWIRGVVISVIKQTQMTLFARITEWQVDWAAAATATVAATATATAAVAAVAAVAARLSSSASS